MSEEGLEVTMMLALEVPDQELIERLLLRGKSSGRADDQSEEIIVNRIAVYKKQTEIVKQFYEKQGKFISVDGTGGIDVVFGRLCDIIDRYI